jgi:hypothetical protein
MHDPAKSLAKLRVGEILFVPETYKGDAVGEVDRALARDELAFLTPWFEGLGLGLESLALLGRKLETCQRIVASALEDIDTIERLFECRAELMKVSHGMR